jgi:hypothetical protein|tara:strand:- start:434 stop:625 length:192 start_codon:yes stop_codon:yes gene_type:complete
MSLTEQVETSLRDAQGNLRNALAFAARTEEPYVNKHIADMLSNIDALISVKDLMDKVENQEEL